jgi:hypothetical protein
MFPQSWMSLKMPPHLLLFIFLAVLGFMLASYTLYLYHLSHTFSLPLISCFKNY